MNNVETKVARDVIGFMIVLMIIPILGIWALDIPFTWQTLSVPYTWELSLFYMTLLPWYLFCYKNGDANE